MQLERWGSAADHGRKKLDLPIEEVTFDAVAGCVTLASSAILDFSGSARHDYEVKLSMTDLARALEAVAQEASRHPSEQLDEQLGAWLRPMLQLGIAAVLPRAHQLQR